MPQPHSGGQPTRRSAIFALFLIGICCTLPRCKAELPPEGIPGDAQPFKGLNNEHIDAWTAGSRLFLVPMRLAAKDNEGIKIARLANVLKKIHLQPDGGQQVQLQPETDHWLIKTGGKPEDAATMIVMELDEPARVFDESIVSEPDSGNVITLPAKFATTHGRLLRFEPQPHKNTVGYWADVKDTAEWRFRTKRPGSYEVDILQGCGKGHGGSQVDLLIGEQKLIFEVQETGHFQNFIWRTIGTVDLPETDKGVLSLIPVHKAAGAVMDVRCIRLVPTGTKRTFDPELADPDALPKEQ